MDTSCVHSCGLNSGCFSEWKLLLYRMILGQLVWNVLGSESLGRQTFQAPKCGHLVFQSHWETTNSMKMVEMEGYKVSLSKDHLSIFLIENCHWGFDWGQRKRKDVLFEPCPYLLQRINCVLQWRGFNKRDAGCSRARCQDMIQRPQLFRRPVLKELNTSTLPGLSVRSTVILQVNHHMSISKSTGKNRRQSPSPATTLGCCQISGDEAQFSTKSMKHQTQVRKEKQTTFSTSLELSISVSGFKSPKGLPHSFYFWWTGRAPLKDLSFLLSHHLHLVTFCHTT